MYVVLWLQGIQPDGTYLWVERAYQRAQDAKRKLKTLAASGLEAVIICT